MKRLGAALLLLWASSHLAACGGSECGNGKPEPGEECDDGNNVDDDACSNSCKVHETRDAQLIWTMVANEAEGFHQTCPGIGAAKVHLVITGPMPMTLDRDCGDGQYMLRALAGGSYSMTGTLFDATGSALTSGATKVDFVIPAAPTGTPTQVTLDFPFADFVKDYSGSLYYLFKWSGMATCTSALPPVVTRTMRLERSGLPVQDGNGVVYDGATAAPCVDPSVPPQVPMVKWGPVDLVVEGRDATSTPQFRETFHTFIGAGITTPIMTYDVNSLQPDAGVPDAATPDAAHDAG